MMTNVTGSWPIEPDRPIRVMSAEERARTESLVKQAKDGLALLMVEDPGLNRTTKDLLCSAFWAVERLERYALSQPFFRK